MNFINRVHAFDKDNLQIYFQNIVTFRQLFLKTIAIWSEQLAHQYCNIASQYCNVARKRTSGLTVKLFHSILSLSLIMLSFRITHMVLSTVLMIFNH